MSATTIFVLFLLASTISSVSFLVGAALGSHRKEKAEKVVVAEKATKTLEDVKRRFSYQRLLDMQELDGAVMTVDEFEDLVENTTNEYLERQARFFLECALGLMAHSYKDFDEMKMTAVDMFEMAFDDWESKKYPNKDNGGENVEERA